MSMLEGDLESFGGDEDGEKTVLPAGPAGEEEEGLELSRVPESAGHPCSGMSSGRTSEALTFSPWICFFRSASSS